MTGVVFDFGNVLYRVDYRAMAEALVPRDVDGFLAAFVGSDRQLAHETGAGDLDSVLRNLAKRGYAFGRDAFLRAFLDIFTPVPGMASLLGRLARHHPLGLLSNTSPEHARFIESTPEFRLFRVAAYSFEVGRMKPHPATYRAVAARLGRPPAELIYVDDLPVNTAGAAAVGMTGITFDDAPSLARRLTELGLQLDDA